MYDTWILFCLLFTLLFTTNLAFGLLDAGKGRKGYPSVRRSNDIAGSSGTVAGEGQEF